MGAVAYHRVEEVAILLDKGADPNYYCDEFDSHLDDQPTTPLRVVVFCIADATLDEEDLRKFIPITQMLLKAGADPKPARKLSIRRYENFEESENQEGVIFEILRLIFSKG